MMKKIFLMAFMVSLVASILMAQEVKPGKVEVIDLGKGIKLEMVFIPAGKFKMGSPESEKGRQKNETQHCVCPWVCFSVYLSVCPSILLSILLISVCLFA